jgi:hypothetical protein
MAKPRQTKPRKTIEDRLDSIEKNMAVFAVKQNSLIKHFENHLHLHGKIIAGVFSLLGSIVLGLIFWVSKFLWALGHTVK